MKHKCYIAILLLVLSVTIVSGCSSKKEEPANETDNTIVSEAVDIKDYPSERTRGCNGTLEDQIAEKLNSKVVDESLPGGYKATVCDGNIIFTDATNGTGYCVHNINYVPGFTIFRVFPGMDMSEADQLLKAQGLNPDGTGNYAKNIREYYVSINESEGKVKSVTYVKVYHRDNE